MEQTTLDEALPPAPEGWTRHVDRSAREVEYRYTEGLAARAKLTVREAPDGRYRLASKRGCRVVSETEVASVEAAVRSTREAFDVD